MADRGRTEQQVGKCFSSHVVFRRRVLFYVYNTEIYTLAVRMLTPFDDVELRNLVKSAKSGVLTRRVIKPALTRHGVISARCQVPAHRSPYCTDESGCCAIRSVSVDVSTIDRTD